ncbi:hypothetical protein C1H46_008121 [Malus baccata]|uniref:Uncharacterized protein n=1 Tax=Malus baccata TaxID=106549 RepID=A0A540N5F5_MALBA|nr:hypothetical protein C1H46_008121 [Malus baccata]
MGEVWVGGEINANGFVVVSMPLENRNDCLLAVSVRRAQCWQTEVRKLSRVAEKE